MITSVHVLPDATAIMLEQYKCQEMQKARGYPGPSVFIRKVSEDSLC